jgi:hypothetical protein
VSLDVTCTRCHRTLDQPGAIVISPPVPQPGDLSVQEVTKAHICVDCNVDLEQWVHDTNFEIRDRWDY